MKKLKKCLLGSYKTYNDEKASDDCKYFIETFPDRWLKELREKRKNYYNQVKVVNSQIIHRPLNKMGYDPLMQIGSWGIKFEVEGPKWPIRKISNWKRKKIKKWQNNKRVYA